MVEQKSIGLNSREEANPFNKDGMLPLITAPMYSVVDEHNFQVFLDNNIQVCMPRGIKIPLGDVAMVKLDKVYEQTWFALSLSEFIDTWCDSKKHMAPDLSVPRDDDTTCKYKICIDTANGNMPALHAAIRASKAIYGNNIQIMAGNVGSTDAFVALAEAGADYIRVGIGGGAGCNTTSNVGVGQCNLDILIHECKRYITYHKDINTKIVADGISTFIKNCEKDYGFNDNGYAAINMLLNEGADLVMIGSLFAQCIESAGKKSIHGGFIDNQISIDDWHRYKHANFQVKMAGMSTQEEQRKYQPDVSAIKELAIQKIRPSEGSIKWIPVRWSLGEWLYGTSTQDNYPYLTGWINSIKSAMAYTGKRTLS